MCEKVEALPGTGKEEENDGTEREFKVAVIGIIISGTGALQ